MLSDVHEEYNINVNKITCCVTDNGSNCVKAFKEFSADVEHAVSHEDSEEEYAEPAYDVEEAQVDCHDLMQPLQTND